MATSRASRRFQPVDSQLARSRQMASWRMGSRKQCGERPSSYLGPVANEIVIDAAQFDRFRVIAAETLYQCLNRIVEVEDQGACALVAHHALEPEKRSHPRAARDRCHHMQTGSRIKYEVPGRQFDLV